MRSPFNIVLVFAGFNILSSHADKQANPVVKVPSHAPQDASQVIDHGFAGVAMKGYSWPNFTTTFSQNLYDALASRTGTDLIIRLGGTAIDHTIYDLNQPEAIKIHKTHGLRSPSTVGKPWFDYFAKLKNVRFIIQFGFARDHGHNYTEAVGYVQHALDKLGGCNSSKLVAVELGNEPNLYVQQGARNSPYTPVDYAKEAATFMDVLQGNISCLKEGRKFQAWQQSSSISKKAWSTKNFMKKAKGIINFDKVSTVAQHFYATQDSSDLQETLLNHTFTTSRTDSFFKESIEVVQQNNTPLNFIIDEVGNANVNASDDVVNHLSKSLGSAVWTVDWMLYAMSINVTRVNMQSGSHMSFADWTPSGLQGGWYGHVFVTDFIGNNTKNELRVKELKNIRKETNSPHLVGYVGFEHGKLAKVALLNLELWKGKKREGYDRPSTHLDLDLPGVANGTVATIRRLTGPTGIALENITWAGLDWPKSKDGKETRVKDNVVQRSVEGEKLDVTVNATEAILVTW